VAERLIDRLAMRTAYLGPFRAVPERLYRQQSVAIEQLDTRGANLAMFIAALNATERTALNDFLHRSLSFRVHIEQSKGQYELRIELDGQTYNLLDVGFGYSQVLPVAVQLWAAGEQKLSTSRTSDRIAVMVVEQPELHLHPHHQVLVARAMATSAMTDHGPMQIIETHSDHLVSEIGLLVAEGKLDANRVGVLCIEPIEGGASVRMATYDEDGILQNWPAGFLAP
jgi:predicted ATPase